MLPVAGKFFAQKTKNLIVVDQKGLETICFLGENQRPRAIRRRVLLYRFHPGPSVCCAKTNKVFRATLSIGLTLPPQDRNAGETFEVERIGGGSGGSFAKSKIEAVPKEFGKKQTQVPKRVRTIRTAKRMGECFFMPFVASFYGGSEPDENQTAKAGRAKR